jgi:hypothetical protein
LLLTWSRWSVYFCLALWPALISIYIELGDGRAAVVPPMIVHAVLTTLSGVGWVASWVARKAVDEVRLVVADSEARIDLAGDLRYNRLLGPVRAILRHCDEMDGPTLALPRQRVVASVAAPAGAYKAAQSTAGLDPEVVDLFRRLNDHVANLDEQ